MLSYQYRLIMVIELFRAAKDGMLDVLKEASKREINAKDEAGMSMVLWAAFEGKLDALRMLVGKG